MDYQRNQIPLSSRAHIQFKSLRSWNVDFPWRKYDQIIHVFLKGMDKQTLSCKSNNASISLFFNISDKGNDFFKFTENIDNGLDLSLLLD